MSQGLSVRVPLVDARDPFFARLFSRLAPEVSEQLRREFQQQALPATSGLIWLTDHALMVFEENGELVVNRANLEAILNEVTPVELPRASNIALQRTASATPLPPLSFGTVGAAVKVLR